MSKFDREKAKDFLLRKEAQEREENETTRKESLQKVSEFLKREFSGQNVEVYLVGSITQPFQFTTRSDIDVVLKNFHGDRFDIGSRLESALGRNIEIILYERCAFQDHVIKYGLKII